MPLEPVPDAGGGGHARQRPEEASEQHALPARPEGEHRQGERDGDREPPEGGHDHHEVGQDGLEMTTHSVAFLPLGGDGGTRRWFPIHTPTQIFEGRVFFPH